MISSNPSLGETPPVGGWPLQQHLINQWQRALAGDRAAQAGWLVAEGGEWSWYSDGVRVKNSGPEWSGLSWQEWRGVSKDASNFVIEVTICGKAEAAGLSFGPYKDFLAPVDSNGGARHLHLKVDVEAGCWAFRVDGQLMTRGWWDSAISGVQDLTNGVLTLKAKRVESLLFQNLTLHTFQASCQLSVIMTCYRFLQRLRVSLRNWCHQDSSSGAYELLIVNPQSPDGTHEHLAAVSRSYPHVRVREIAISSNLPMNKGAMINRALAVSRGEWIWLTDADCLFAPDCAAAVVSQIKGQPHHLFYGQRRYLTAAQTDALLAGRVDGLREFAELAAAIGTRPPDNAPWGYTQILHRSMFERVRYREDFDHFARSDSIFIKDCKRHHITPRQIQGLFCLHMDHPFSWYGTDFFL